MRGRRCSTSKSTASRRRAKAAAARWSRASSSARTSWFHDNGTNRFGGGIALDGAEALLELRRARVTDNQNAQGDGGGIAVIEGEARLIDTTVAENRATGHGGGIHNLGTLELINATIV